MQLKAVKLPRDKQKVCQRCSQDFFGGTSAKYCFDCKEEVLTERQRLAAKAYYERKKNGQN